MIIRAVIIFFYCMMLINIPAHAGSIDKSLQSKLLLIENEIYQIANKNGLSKPDITIHWKQTISGNYDAVINCNNSKKCNMSGVVISFPKINIQSNQFVRDSSLQDTIQNEIKPLFNTGNPGPDFSPPSNDN